MNQFNWFNTKFEYIPHLRFQYGPYACLTVKFQHIGKSQIVDSDIDSLDSVWVYYDETQLDGRGIRSNAKD